MTKAKKEIAETPALDTNINVPVDPAAIAELDSKATIVPVNLKAVENQYHARPQEMSSVIDFIVEHLNNYLPDVPADSEHAEQIYEWKKALGDMEVFINTHILKGVS